MSTARSDQPAHGGVVIPMVSPFTDDGRPDEPAIRRILDHVLDAGVAGILLLGTTGEAASIRRSDRVRLVEVAVEHIAGRGRTYAGIADNSFEESVGAAQEYQRLGVDAYVAHLPTNYPLGAAEMQAWFERLADRVPGPLFLYNIPMTTRMSIPVETVDVLSHHPNIAGMKDSEYDAGRLERVLGRVRDRTDFAYFVGPSVMARRGLELGAAGFVPGVGNVLPDACQRLLECARAGDWAGADEAQERMKRIGDTYQTGRSVTHGVALLKVALSTLGLCRPTVLPPLLPPPDEECRAVAAAVAALTGRAPAEA